MPPDAPRSSEPRPSSGEKRSRSERFWDRVLRRELAEYAHATTPLEPDRLKTIAENAAEAAKEARTLFLLHLSLTAYGFLAVGSMRDASIYSTRSTIALPVVDVEVPASVFFVSLPVLAILVSSYMQLYLGYLERLNRRLRLGSAAHRDADLRFPWIATIAEHAGAYGRLTSAVFGFLVWATTPLLLAFLWWRLLPIRSSLGEWIDPREWPGARGLPAASFVACATILSGVLAIGWSSARRELSARLGLPVARPSRPARIALAGFVALVALVTALDTPHRVDFAIVGFCRGVRQDPELTTFDLPLGRRSWGGRCGRDVDPEVVARIEIEGAARPGRAAPRDMWTGTIRHSSIRPFTVDLHDESLSTPATDTRPATGASLSEADLTGANLSGAFLDRAMFIHSRLVHANAVGAQMNEAVFSISFEAPDRFDPERSTMLSDLTYVRLRDAQMQRATLCNTILVHADLTATDLRGADLRGADLRDARLSGTRLDYANLEHANLIAASIEQASFAFADLDHARLTPSGPLADALPPHAFRELPGGMFLRPDFTGATLVLAELAGASILESGFDGIVATALIARGAHLDGSSFVGADLTKADFTKARLRRVDLTGASLVNALLDQAVLDQAILEAADLSGVDLDPPPAWLATIRGAHVCRATTDPPLVREGLEVVTDRTRCRELRREALLHHVEAGDRDVVRLARYGLAFQPLIGTPEREVPPDPEYVEPAICRL